MSMLRRLNVEPLDTEFIPYKIYESETPVAFGLPEIPILFAKVAWDVNGVWITSDGLYLWTTNSEQSFGAVYDVDDLKIDFANKQIFIDSQIIQLGPGQPEEVASALNRCKKLFVLDDPGIDIAVPYEYEKGEADDLGEVNLIESLGSAPTLAQGSAVPLKRRRPS
ncbi:hypothetical protein DASB73_014910 [Starmerella bacillaris]|uniref:Uncharacterized protein n=1 Tax=Starmerella bacillaris TaxID=1247836 RepID=A0AAV5RIF6_STABA|nr:hypothetical protein DASB73_014910 [Starmerella bacillaris]